MGADGQGTSCLLLIGLHKFEGYLEIIEFNQPYKRILMLTDVKFIPEEIATKIKAAAVLEDVIADYVQLSKKGSQLKGDCPSCNAKKKFDVSASKKIAKCWVCNKSAKDAIGFLKTFKDMDYVPALATIAERYNIEIEQPKPKSKKKKSNRKESFRNQQLRESGIKVSEQKYWLTESNGSESTKYECDRYQSASVDKFFNTVIGDDMVLNYLDLDGKPITFQNNRRQRQILTRVRWANPDLHTDKNGKPMKYQSPPKSGSHLWIPNKVIEAFRQGIKITTLHVEEGEKKADKMCKHGMYAVGIMGIHNFANAEMPYVFERLIKKCDIKNMIFGVDADWQELSLKQINRSVDSRPYTFFKAVLKFRDYFKAFYNSGIELEIFFAYGKNNALKGVDDLLVRELKGKEDELWEDFENTMRSRDGVGKYVNVHKITEMSGYKLKEFWHIQSPIAFMAHYKEQLKKLKQFKLGKFKRRWNEEEQKFEIDQKILPHEQFWKKIFDGYDKNEKEKFKYGFHYVNILTFLRNRGFALYELSDSEKQKDRFIHVDGKVVYETNPKKIRRYVIDFSREEVEEPVLEMLLRGGRQYLGPDKLSDLFFNRPQFNTSQKDCHYLYFKNGYWKITADKIEQRPLSELPKHIWESQIIDFEPKYMGKPMIDVQRKGDKWQLKKSESFNKSDIATFYEKTSNFHWKKTQELKTNEKGVARWDDRKTKEEILPEDRKILADNLVAKMVAAGYLMHDFLDFSNMKAVVCMDGLESRVGESNGGTGKGAWCGQFEKLVPVHWINGKRRNLDDDKHIHGGVTEATKIIYYEDLRVNFDFENLFPVITRGTWVEKKGVDGHKEDPKKVLLDTNHALNGSSNSFARRQFNISFSDYYNKQRTIADDYGYQLFEEWPETQWNSFYNWIATCCQVYLKYRLEYAIPQNGLEKRKLRQAIGEKFMEWATGVFDKKDGIFLNQKISKSVAWEMFLEEYPMQKKYVDTAKFKKMMILYADYAELEFNPTTEGERLMSNGKEFFIIADNDFNVKRLNTIRTKQDIDRITKPLNPDA